MLSKLDAETRNSMIGLLILSISSVLFWTLFDQGPTSLNLFAGCARDNQIGDSEFPAACAAICEPVFHQLCLRRLSLRCGRGLGDRGWEPNAFIKFGFAMVQIGAGFYILNLGIQTATPDAQGALRISVVFIHPDVPASHDGRNLPVTRGPISGHQNVRQADRWVHDGLLVPRQLLRQCHRRSSRQGNSGARGCADSRKPCSLQCGLFAARNGSCGTGRGADFRQPLPEATCEECGRRRRPNRSRGIWPTNGGLDLRR